MKKTLILLGFSASCAFSTTIQVTTGGASGATILNNAGANILGEGATAFAAFGIFNDAVLTPRVSTDADLASSFRVLSPIVGLAPASFLANSRAATFNIANVLKSSIPASDIGANIAVVVWTGGTGNDFTGATEASVFKFDATYDTGGTPTAINYGTGALLEGAAAFGSRTQTAQLFVIPEPSAVLLGGLALLGGLIRRRR